MFADEISHQPCLTPVSSHPDLTRLLLLLYYYQQQQLDVVRLLPSAPHLPVSIFLPLFVWLSVCLFYLSVWLSVCIVFALSICLSVCLTFSLSFSVSVYVYVYVYVYLYVGLSRFCPLYLSICLSDFFSFRLCLCVCVCVCDVSVSVSVWLSLSLSFARSLCRALSFALSLLRARLQPYLHHSLPPPAPGGWVHADAERASVQVNFPSVLWSADPGPDLF